MLTAQLCFVSAFADDCNGNGVEDRNDLRADTSADCNGNRVPDECDVGLQFGRRPASALGEPPVVLRAADFDGDGVKDLMAGSGGRVSVLFNREEAFDLVDFSAGDATRIEGLAVGDLDGDGDVDAVAAATSTLWVLHNQGDGDFDEAVGLQAGGLLSSLALGDVNGDAHLDLIYASKQLHTVSVRLGTGGAFGEATDFSTGTSPRSLLLVDLDGDGLLDVSTVNRSSSDISVLLGKADGSFQREYRVTPTGLVKPDRLVAADFDGDGLVDLAASNATAIVLFKNQGELDGVNGNQEAVFTEGASFQIESVNALASADLDGDGDEDLVAPRSTPTNLTCILNSGNGTFEGAVDVELKDTPAHVLPVDLDGDGDDDLALAMTVGSGVDVLWNGEDSDLELSSELFVISHRPHSITTADLDNDGDTDIATGNGHEQTVSIVLNNDGNLSAALLLHSGGSAFSITSGDFDRDGVPDLAVVDLENDLVNVFRNAGDGSEFEKTAYPVGIRPFFVTTADLNGDGYSDLVTTNSASRSISILLNQRDGTFVGRPNLVVGNNPLAAAAGDFDQDGDQDLAVANERSSTVGVLMNDGTARFPERRSYGVEAPHHVSTADFDNDGDLDLVTANRVATSVSLLRNNGSGVFDQILTRNHSLESYSAIPADVNADGLMDLVTASASGNAISVSLNRDGDLDLPFWIDVGINPRFVVDVDLEGDGKRELVAANRSSQSLTVLRNEVEITGAPYLESICTEADFFQVSIASNREGLVERLTKFIVPADPEDLALLPPLFQNVRRFALHQKFLATAFPHRFPALTPELYDQMVNRRESREYFVGNLFRLRFLDEVGVVHGFNVVTDPHPDELPRVEEVRTIAETLGEVFDLRPLVYCPDTRATREAAATWSDPGFDIRIHNPSLHIDYEPYSLAVGYGTVRILAPWEFVQANASGEICSGDILILEEAPRDIEGVVAGSITAEVQGELGHLAVRTARRGTPNAFVRNAARVFAPFEGKLVRLEVQEADFSVREADPEEAAEFLAGHRPSLSSLPEIDGSFAEFSSLAQINDQEGDDVDVVSRFGGKASNLARLQSILTGPWSAYREKGFAIPLKYYLDFMRSNMTLSHIDSRPISFDEHLAELFADTSFQTDCRFRFDALENLRAQMEGSARINAGLLADIAARVSEIMETPTDLSVRYRSSSNVEDAIEFNGAGLYGSTSGCSMDDLDDDNDGPSHCDPTRRRERGISRALKRVWASLWNFRAYQERAFFDIPQELAAMGVLVNRTFTDEVANGVAFTGNPSNPLDRNYVVAVQVGENSVVSPLSGQVAEKNILVVEDGEVREIVRSVSSSLIPPGELVLSDAQLHELGKLMAHVDQSFPLETGGFPREQTLLDIEFKFLADGELAVKQVRPFLLSSEIPPAPTFELEIPPGTEVCGTFLGRNDLGAEVQPLEWHELKTTLRFVPGRIPLPTRSSTFTAELFEEVRVGPERRLAVADRPGIFRVKRSPRDGDRTVYNFEFEQIFFVEDARYSLQLSNVKYEAIEDRPIETTRVLDEEFVTRSLELEGFLDQNVGYSSCSHELLPRWIVSIKLDDGSTLDFLERHEPALNIDETGPASLVFADLNLRGRHRQVSSYWHLIYSAQRHNLGRRYWTFLDPPLELEGFSAAVHVVEVVHPQDDPIVIEGRVRYLDESFEVIASPGILSFERAASELSSESFQRGDLDSSGQSDTTDVLRLLVYLFASGPGLPCHKAADTNDDGRLNLSDAINLAIALFRGGRPLPEPFASCGSDRTEDALSCGLFPACRGL